MDKITWIQVITTTDSISEAETISRALVEKKLAACVQLIGPIMSVYSWQGKIETTEEYQLQIKSNFILYPEIEKEIVSLHSYKTPEIICTPIIGGSNDYIDWIKENTKGQM